MLSQLLEIGGVTVDRQPSPIRREELWLYIRQKPSSAYTSEQTRLVAERIVSIDIVIFYLLKMFHY